MKIFGHKITNPFAKKVNRDVLNVDALSNFTNTYFDGDKFYGGFGATQVHVLDYWTLRQRSSQLFNENLYARGIIRRLITNEINTGLTPELRPDESIIGVPEDSLNDWADDVETRFELWSANPKVCDYGNRETFGGLQRLARSEALIGGDVLVVLHQSAATHLPQVQLVRGDKVRTPLGDGINLRDGNEIRHGVELDKKRRVVAHWVLQDNGSSKRIPAFGVRTGRRLSWLVYGTDKRLDDVRGTPLLSLVLQSLKEIDRYRDSTQRKVALNSTLAMFIKKTEDKLGTLPMTGGAVRRSEATVNNGNTDGSDRKFEIAEQIPGLILQELQHGEEPVGFNHNTDVDFGPFEASIIQAVAWANEMPPEILTLAFSSNYSASQAATNEFKIYLNKIWVSFGAEFNNPIFIDFLTSETLLQKINAPGLLEAWRDPTQYDVFGAWVAADWYGSIKPSIDILKQAKGSKLLVEEGWTTNARESRITTGTKFSQNIKRLKQENILKAEALRPLLELQREFAANNGADNNAPNTITEEKITALIDDAISDMLDDQPTARLSAVA